MRLLFLCFLVASFALAAPGSSRDDKKITPELAELVSRVDAKTTTIDTIKARFNQRKEISLLKEPVEMKGDFYFKRSSGFKFEFDKEHDLMLLITKQETISLSPASKKADRIKMKKRYGQLVERLLSDKIASLSKNFRIERAVDAEPVVGHHLVLTPTKRRFKKRFTNLQVWITEEYLINRLKVISRDGDVYELSLKNVRLNEEIPESFFDVTIPEGYDIGDRMEFLFGPDASL